MDPRYSIDELARLAGVSGRTVRYYVQRGLIPPPAGRGPGRHYGQEHLERILHLRTLQREGLTLDGAIHSLDGGSRRPAMNEPVHRELVTRIRLDEGRWLEIAPGADVPSDHQLRELVRCCQEILDPARRKTAGGR